jgi:hypothetical protein
MEGLSVLNPPEWKVSYIGEKAESDAVAEEIERS